FRTVKVSRSPPPWRRRMNPWKTCTRCRDPSTTRTWTLTVSPGRKSGRSSRSWSRSTTSVICIAGYSFEQQKQASGRLPGRAPCAGGTVHHLEPRLRSRRYHVGARPHHAAAAGGPGGGGPGRGRSGRAGRAWAGPPRAAGGRPGRGGPLGPPLEQVRAQPPGALQGLLAPPGGDRAVVAGAQDLGDLQAAVDGRPGGRRGL